MKTPYQKLQELVDITRNYVNDEDFSKLPGPEQLNVIKSAYELVNMEKGGPGSGRRSGYGTGRRKVPKQSELVGQDKQERLKVLEQKIKEAKDKGDEGQVKDLTVFYQMLGGTVSE